MRFLIKDLSRLTGFSPARIRKWQERFQFLRPIRGENGYHYYDNEDLQLLLSIQNRLLKGQKLRFILRLTPGELLSEKTTYSQTEWQTISAIARSEFQLLEQKFDEVLLHQNFPFWIRHTLHEVLLLTGDAWSKGILSVADEHAFSHWLRGYLLAKAENLRSNVKPLWLVAVFPGDEHELGALLHYLRLLHYRVPARFCGMLPEEHLIQELHRAGYRAVSLSVVLPRSGDELNRLRTKIIRNTAVQRIHFGGYGYSGRNRADSMPTGDKK